MAASIVKFNVVFKCGEVFMNITSVKKCEKMQRRIMDRIKYKDWESIIVLCEKFCTDRVRLNVKIRFKISNRKTSHK